MIVVFVYMDESFDTNEFWVTGLIVPESEAIALEAALDQVVLNAAHAYGVAPEAELHGNDLMHGKRDWDPLNGKFRARFGVFLDCLSIIAKTRGIRAYSYGLDIPAQKRRYSNPIPPRQVLIGHVAQRCHSRLSPGEVLTLIVDDNPAQADIRAHVRTLKHRTTMSRVNSKPLANILDTVYFARSCDSRLLQAADLVSYAHFRARVTPQASRSYAAGQQAWNIVEPMCTPVFWRP